MERLTRNGWCMSDWYMPCKPQRTRPCCYLSYSASTSDQRAGWLDAHSLTVIIVLSLLYC